MKELANEGALTVLTNDFRAARDFRDAQFMFQALKPTKEPTGTLRLGAWFDGEGFTAPHLLVVDEGVFPRGLGVHTDSALTLIRLNSESATLEKILLQIAESIEGLRDRRFRGLCQWGLDLSPSGELKLSDGTVSGWPKLHTHAFVSELENFGGVLEGATPNLPSKFTTVIAVTKPPWPYPVMHSPGQHKIEGLTDEEIGQVFWHDVAVDQETRTVSTAGLDGMVGIVRGAGNSFELAQAQALYLAGALQFPEKQYRFDAGEQVRGVLAVLEKELEIVV